MQMIEEQIDGDLRLGKLGNVSPDPRGSSAQVLDWANTVVARNNLTSARRWPSHAE